MSIEKVVFQTVNKKVDLRDPAEKEFKRIADRLRRLAKERYNRPICVTIAVDQDSQTDQLVGLAVALEEETIKDALKAKKDALKAKIAEAVSEE